MAVCRMRYVAAYLLAALGGAASPSAKDIKAILSSVGIEADDERLNKVRFGSVCVCVCVCVVESELLFITFLLYKYTRVKLCLVPQHV